MGNAEVIVINPVEVNLVFSKDLVEQVKLAQIDDAILAKFMQSSTDISVDNAGVARFRGRVFVPKWQYTLKDDLRGGTSFEVLYSPRDYIDVPRFEAHKLVVGMKKDAVDFVSKCQACQEIKV